MKTATPHEARIRAELTAAGMTRYGHLKFASRYLHHFVHENEHILGTVYGRYLGGEALLVATERRVIFLDKKPLFASSDEFSYAAVSGVKFSSIGPLVTVTLHTRLGDFQVRYANKAAARQFVRAVEAQAVEHRPSDAEHNSSYESSEVQPLEADAEIFLNAHNLAVLSSVDRTGRVAAAAVYYTVGPQNQLYILTRSGTAKARNILAHQQVALTVVEEVSARTLQLQGLAEVESDSSVRDVMFDKLSKHRANWHQGTPPPVMQLTKGVFVVLRINLTSAVLRNFDHRDPVSA